MMKSVKRTNANNARPFCGVCQKAGKPESVFRGHFTKSKPGADGVVICPTILSIECRFCHEKGHSASEEHCPTLREKMLRKKEWEREDRIQEREMKKKEEKKVVLEKKSVTNNRFSEAFDDSDDDEEEVVKAVTTKLVVEPIVPIVKPKPVCESVRKFSYASMLKRETPVDTPVTPEYTLTPFIQESKPDPIVIYKEPKLIVEIKPKTNKKIEALKEYYKPIPLEMDEDDYYDDEDEFAYDVNFMSKGYVANDAW